MPTATRIVPAAAALAALFLAPAFLPAQQAPCAAPPELRGTWAQQGGPMEVRFEPERVVVLRQDGELRAATILSRGPCKLLVRYEGLRSTWTVTGDAHGLKLDCGDATAPAALLPLAREAHELDISPARLPPAEPVPAAEAKAVATELTARSQRDQDLAFSADAEQKARRTAILTDNLRYLREVVGRYGWIDIPRFGKPAAAAAILILKHGVDVPLMEAALPIVEHDAIANGGGKELVSILVDEVLLTTGHKQKYGTQLSQDAQGRPFALPVEDPAKVDEYRRLLGILSWADYLKLASDALYKGAPVRVPTADE